ncbi:hypothetical protein LVY72_00030 [Arthrobacter sp. I2-34]|uniref:Uncharacterized protein n=1 Tax=Arthrobacter hankyongi TaxID=2904801 RepID=A0ABS9L0U2_9MICC|nr:DUF6544 family protein [Arthrobacter hankyongi]MCG2620295.1 hypothetical protein [Arthrobacter hankyongi]
MKRGHRIPRAAAADWALLGRRPGTASARPEAFDPAALSALPEPARRWLTHAIDAGTPLWGTAELQMLGQIRLGDKWFPFTARQIIAPGRGFVWAARTRVRGLPVSGFDRYRASDPVTGAAAAGQMRWRLLGVLPAMSARGQDTTRSAAGRLAGEAIFVPTACLSASWSAGTGPDSDADTAVMTWLPADGPEDCQLRVGPGGELREVLMQRWGNPEGTGYRRYSFGVAVEEEAVFSGLRLPGVYRAGWWWGSDRQEEGEFFRARITRATFS